MKEFVMYSISTQKLMFNYFKDGEGAGALALWGGTEGPGLIQPGEETALGRPNSSSQYWQGGHQENSRNLASELALLWARGGTRDPLRSLPSWIILWSSCNRLYMWSEDDHNSSYEIPKLSTSLGKDTYRAQLVVCLFVCLFLTLAVIWI